MADIQKLKYELKVALAEYVNSGGSLVDFADLIEALIDAKIDARLSQTQESEGS